jgi:excisionase family DNA binding protein
VQSKVCLGRWLRQRIGALMASRDPSSQAFESINDGRPQREQKIKPRECPVGPEEAAAFLKVARSTVMSLARAGSIPAHPVTNGRRERWLFFLSELESHVRALGVNCGSHPCAL